MGDAREQFAACEALLNDGAVDACAAAAEVNKAVPEAREGMVFYARRRAASRR